jgi:hemoglobin
MVLNDVQAHSDSTHLAGQIPQDFPLRAYTWYAVFLLPFAFRKDLHEMSDQTIGAAVSDYDAIGGGSAVSAVVNDFYVRVLGDPQLAPYFEGVDMARLKRHQVLLVSQVLGGPVSYEGRPLAEAHDGLGIDHDDFAAVAGHLTAAMRDAGVPEDVIMRAIAVVASTEPDIVKTGSP